MGMNQETEFLQSEDWLRFQEATGKAVIRLSETGFSANGIIHTLPLAGRYLYVPRGPIVGIRNQESGIRNGMRMLFEKAKEKKVSWIRIEPETEGDLARIREAFGGKVVKAPHDMQPRETFVVDIVPDTDTLLASMKPKARILLRLAEKYGVKAFATREEKHRQAFLDLITATADRKDIVPHPRSYYENFFSELPEDICRLFIAEYNGRVLAANIVIFFGGTATYLHGGTADEHRDVMAPYLLQWEQMKFAKTAGCTRYDFGGVKMRTNQESRIKNHEKNNWSGITRFKLGFSPGTEPIVFPGSYDMILDSRAYSVYTLFRHLKKITRRINIFK